MSADITYMQRALALAAKGRFTTSPNPNVGCVIVKAGQIIGEGYHQRAGEAHAEVHALTMAGSAANGATAYVTLEPCSHYGRTPPCADALIAAGIKRVVIAMQDPNPQVAGQGIARLQAAGIEVECGVLTAEAEVLNRGFLKRMRQGRPWVQLKMACSLDGKTAMASGESQWITSAQARQDVQQWRAQSSAILTTSATVLADDPAMTVRWSQLPQAIQQLYPESQLRQPIRVVLDSQQRLTAQAKIFQQPGETWLVRKQAGEVPAGATLLLETSPEPQINLTALMQQLAAKGINTIWVEAGAALAGALLEQQLVDELIIYQAPKLLGDQARDLCILPQIQTLAQAPQFKLHSACQIGPDLRLILEPII